MLIRARETRGVRCARACHCVVAVFVRALSHEIEKPSRRGARARARTTKTPPTRENDDDKKYARWFAFVTFIHTQRYDVRALEASSSSSLGSPSTSRRRNQPLGGEYLCHLVHARAELILEHALRRAFGRELALERRDAARSVRTSSSSPSSSRLTDRMPPVYARG